MSVKTITPDTENNQYQVAMKKITDLLKGSDISILEVKELNTNLSTAVANVKLLFPIPVKQED